MLPITVDFCVGALPYAAGNPDRGIFAVPFYRLQRVTVVCFALSVRPAFSGSTVTLPGCHGGHRIARIGGADCVRRNL